MSQSIPLLENFLCGERRPGAGDGQVLRDPVLGTGLVRVSAEGVDRGAALAFARQTGGPALRALTFAERARLLDKVAALLIAKRANYLDIARQNSGNTDADASFDIDGAIGTIRFFAKLGQSLGETRLVREGEPFALGKNTALQALHIAAPRQGVAVHINAFNFPAWGLWEKAAVSLLAGVPVLAKPAAATSWLAWQMVADVTEAEILPSGALSLLCGSIGDLLDHVDDSDVVSFTGSADTAALVRGHRRVVAHSVRVNCEADSLNAIVLGPDVTASAPEFSIFVQEVVRELTLKAGQKCTAIRRVIVPAARLADVQEALSAALAAVTVGDPRRAEVKMGPLVTLSQQASVRQGISLLQQEAETTYDGSSAAILADDPARGAFVAPLLLTVRDAARANLVHDVEVFGPVASLIPYQRPAEAFALVARGRGSLVSSLVSADASFAREAALAMAPYNGRVLVLDESVRKANPGHGVVVPSCIHGGPGRAGGGEELGGLRGLWFYLQKTALQAPEGMLRELAQSAATLAL
jgi:3,4-dehydroadipyl-CoA semialdehyde dehydrogenase